VSAIRFALGYGWWILWHLFLLSLLLPLAGLFGWLIKVQPGAGPQGGDAAFLLLVWVLGGLSLTTLVNVLLYAATLPGDWVRFPKAAAVGLIAWSVTLFLLWKLANAASRAAPGSTPRSLWMLCLALVFGTVFWFNLSALARYHGWQGR
jgi:hypothetical protein